MADIAAQEEEVSKSDQPFAKCAFGDERRRLARMFTNYFDRTDSTSGYVANLNGEWGTGKTFFVTEWSKQLKTDRNGVVFIDAWKSDYLDDPLAIIVAELLNQLTEQLKNEFDYQDTKKIKGRILTAASALTKSFLPAVTLALAKKYLGTDFIEAYQQCVGDVQDLINSPGADSINDRLGEFGEFVFSAHQRHIAFSENFKKEIENIIAEIVKRSRGKKVYVFIDELDRCRPTYAIEMLETIKHLFDIKNLVFIISTDTAQLEHSIKAVYGSGFDSFEYLHRFFKQRITLPKPDYYKFLCMENAFDNVDFSYHHFYPKIDSANKLRALVALQAETNGVELRKLETIYSQMEAFLSNITLKKRSAIDLVYLTVILFTINIIQDIDEPCVSIRAPRADTANKIKVNTIYVCRDASQNTAIKYHELAMDIVSEFFNLNKINEENFHPKQFNLQALTEGAASSLFSELQYRSFYDYVYELIVELKSGDTTLLTQNELKQMITMLKIQDAFAS